MVVFLDSVDRIAAAGGAQMPVVGAALGGTRPWTRTARMTEDLLHTPEGAEHVATLARTLLAAWLATEVLPFADAALADNSGDDVVAAMVDSNGQCLLPLVSVMRRLERLGRPARSPDAAPDSPLAAPRLGAALERSPYSRRARECQEERAARQAELARLEAEALDYFGEEEGPLVVQNLRCQISLAAATCMVRLAEDKERNAKFHALMTAYVPLLMQNSMQTLETQLVELCDLAQQVAAAELPPVSAAPAADHDASAVGEVAVTLVLPGTAQLGLGQMLQHHIQQQAGEGQLLQGVLLAEDAMVMLEDESAAASHTSAVYAVVLDAEALLAPPPSLNALLHRLLHHPVPGTVVFPVLVVAADESHVDIDIDRLLDQATGVVELLLQRRGLVARTLDADALQKTLPRLVASACLQATLATFERRLANPAEQVEHSAQLSAEWQAFLDAKHSLYPDAGLVELSPEKLQAMEAALEAAVGQALAEAGAAKQEFDDVTSRWQAALGSDGSAEQVLAAAAAYDAARPLLDRVRSTLDDALALRSRLTEWSLMSN